MHRDSAARLDVYETAVDHIVGRVHELLEDRIRSLRSKHRRVWYMADGLYSMHGDFSPMELPATPRMITRVFLPPPLSDPLLNTTLGE